MSREACLHQALQTGLSESGTQMASTAHTSSGATGKICILPNAECTLYTGQPDSYFSKQVPAMASLYMLSNIATGLRIQCT